MKTYGCAVVCTAGPQICERCYPPLFVGSGAILDFYCLAAARQGKTTFKSMTYSTEKESWSVKKKDDCRLMIISVQRNRSNTRFYDDFELLLNFAWASRHSTIATAVLGTGVG